MTAHVSVLVSGEEGAADAAAAGGAMTKPGSE
jgi:hypothetical protein